MTPEEPLHGVPGFFGIQGGFPGFICSYQVTGGAEKVSMREKHHKDEGRWKGLGLQPAGSAPRA